MRCESIISIDSLLVYENKYYLQVYLNNCAYKIGKKEITDYVDDNIFQDPILKIVYYDRIYMRQGIDRAKSDNSKE